MNNLRKIKINVPRWAKVAYLIISIGLIPWTIYLGFHLPTIHLTRNWDITWVGLDIAIIISLLSTGILAKLNSIYLILSATVTGTLFITDAWFDVLGYQVGSVGQSKAILMALFGELPMAIFSFGLAIRTLKHIHSKIQD